MAQKWIQKAVKRKGRLKGLAKKEGGLDAQGKIKMSWLQGKKKAAGKRGDRSMLSAINLAIRFKRGKI